MTGDYKCPTFLSEQARDLISKILNIDPELRFTIDQIKQHPWFRITRVDIKTGIMIGFDRVLVDEDVLSQLSQFGFNTTQAKKYIENNKHNNLTTTYYLLFNKLGVAQEIQPKKLQKIPIPKIQVEKVKGILTDRSHTPNCDRNKIELKRPNTTRTSMNSHIRKISQIPKRVSTPKENCRSVSPKSQRPVSSPRPVIKKASQGDNHVKLHRGPFNINCTSVKPYEEIVKSISSALEMNDVNFKILANNNFECEKSKTKFEVEVNSIEGYSGLLFVKFVKIGKAISFENVCEDILSCLSL